ncbi:MAG: peptidylprolyl isomerase [Chitinophagaceae bacterium]
MNKLIGIVCLAFLVTFAQQVQAQTLFTYGKHTVSKQAFLEAFSKNPPPDSVRRKQLDEYLNLYQIFKLKVQAGYDDSLQMLPSVLQESQQFKEQLANNIVNKEADLQTLLEQALERSKKDISAAHIFIEMVAGTDTVLAQKQINEAYTALQNGMPFQQAAAQFSTEPYTQLSQGNLGYITAFTLQYDLENQLYALAPQTFSKPYRSSLGWHIFKNNGERKAVGRRRIAQIFIAIPPSATTEERIKAQQQIDSVTIMLERGVPFEILASTYSNDLASANNGGVVGEIGIGDVEPVFEQKVYDLQNPGDITKPFQSSYGFHIVKLLDVLIMPNSLDSAVTYQYLKQKIEGDERLQLANKLAAKQWLKKVQFKLATDVNFKTLWQYTTERIVNDAAKPIDGINDKTYLFRFEKGRYTVKNWIDYLKTLPNTITDTVFYSGVFNNFIEATCTNFYKANIEKYNSEAAAQIKEFEEANILFAAMDKHVWTKAAEDAVGLQKLYDANKQKYWWNPGVSGMVITAVSKEMCNEIISKLNSDKSNWRSVCAAYGNLVFTDSGRYEANQIPVKSTISNQQPGYISAVESNETEDAFQFFILTKQHPNKEIRSFEDARGAVISDYQQVLEKQWIDNLKKKYPIKLNQAVWKSIQ